MEDNKIEENNIEDDKIEGTGIDDPEFHDRKKLEVSQKLRMGIYALPSLFTCGNMTFGLLSIFQSVDGHFTTAAWFIVCALACDILDGRVARATKTTSEFGVQLDSLSDLISFGVAPAIMMYFVVLNVHPLTKGKIGIAIAVLFVLCSALRLARFNVGTTKTPLSKSFVGLPTPASAGVIISFVLSYEIWFKLDATNELLTKHKEGLFHSLNPRTIPVLIQAMPKFFAVMPVVMIILSFLMVSNIPYESFKRLKFSRPMAFSLLVLLIIIILLIIVFPQNIFFIIFIAYALSGIIMIVPNSIRKKRKKKRDGIKTEYPRQDKVIEQGQDDGEVDYGQGI